MVSPKITKSRTLVALALAFAPMAAAYATDVQLTLSGNPSEGVNPGLAGGLNVTFMNNTYNNCYVGQINWTVTNPLTSNFAQGDKLGTFCIQGLQDVYFGGTYVYSLNSLDSATVPLGGPDQGVIDSLAAKQIQGLANSYYYDVGSSLGSYTADEVGAAFQLGVWEIAYDGGTGGESFPNGYSNFFAQGLFSATASNASGQHAITLANDWLKHFTTPDTVVSTAFQSCSVQDQLLPDPPRPDQTPSTPLPASFPAGLTLFATLGALAVIKKRRTQIA